MTLTHSQIAHHAGIARDEAADLCALGPALSAARLREALGILRLTISRLEGLSVQLEAQERPDSLLVGLERSSLGGWPKS